MKVKEMAKEAKNATLEMAKATTAQKNDALKHLVKALKENSSTLLAANLQDIEEAKKAGLGEAMIDRLSLQNRIDGLCQDLEQVISLPDPVGETFEQQQIGVLTLHKSRTPLGVIGVIYESRPNVTVDISALALKSGNCAILRGGSETLRTNKVLVQLIQESLKVAKLPAAAIQLIPSIDRAVVMEMLRLHESIDLIIPRGGESLHRFCRENSTITVITGGIGVCHLFVDESANLEKSLEVIFNAKTQRPTVCNALDTILVHTKVAAQMVPAVVKFLGEHGVSFRFDEQSWKFMSKVDLPTGSALAKEDDWDHEWLSLVLGIKIVTNLDEALEHIHKHSTGHSDGILTENEMHAKRFVAEVDSAAVYINASTRFTDGSQFGLGAEVAISTQKLHARGPMGLRELTSYKWVIKGDYTKRP